MANALQQQMADGIASLVRKQTFAGSGVWRQSGNATLRIETQTDSLVNALQRIPSVESQEEEERESDRQHAEVIGALENLNASDEGGDSKKGGFFKNMLSGIVGFPIKMIKGLFSGLGSIGKSFKKFGKFLLTPFAFIGTLGGALTATAALVSGLSAIGALFAGVAITSFMLTDAEFEELKNKIAKGVAHVFSEIVEGAVDVYNAFVPEKMQVSEEDKKKFKEATFVTLKDSIISIIDFVKGITDSFGAGFLDATKEKRGPGGEVIQESLKTKFNNFTEAFSNLGTSLGEYGRAIAEMFKGFKVTVDGTTYEGLMGDKGLFGLMGYLTGKLAGGVLDFATAIMNFAADPGKALGELKGTLSAQIDIIGMELGKVFKDIFSYQSIIRQFEALGLGFLIPESAYRAAAEEQKTGAEQQKTKALLNKEKFSMLRLEKQLELEELPVTDFVGRRDAQAQITRASKLIDFFSEEQKSADSLLTTKGGEKASVVEMPAYEKKSAFDFDFSLPTLLKNANQGLANYTMRLIDDAGRIIEISNAAIKSAILPDSAVIDEKQSGGRISQTGLYKLHAGEIVFDPPSSDRIDNFVASYLPQSGAMINGLQMERTMGGTTGSAAPVVIDNSQQPTIINQTNVAAPQTKGPALVGEGRDKVNLKR